MVSVVSFSQNTNTTSNTSQTDSIPPLKYKFKKNQTGGLFLNTPTTKTIEFDKATGKFVIVEKIGDYQVKAPIFLTPEEYDEYRLKNDVKDYFREKVSATDTRKKGNEKARRNLLPKYYINSKFFENVFGGNTVEVVPTGQLNLKLGVAYQNTENPQITQENRSSIIFDFDQQISASLKAKVGTRLQVEANYDTQSTFDFQNLIRLEYRPTEDDILQEIDAGNVSMPINNSLINGAQSLFGVKTRLQFGKTHVTAVFSQQNSESKTVVAEAGATIQEFELRASDYDNDRHFFLGQFFRENYKNALKDYPLISSPININRVEVWVTNRNQNTQDYRSIVAFADIGEGKQENLVYNISSGFVTSNPVTVRGNVIPYNDANNIKDLLASNGGIRDASTIESAVLTEIPGAQQGRDYSYLQNARRLQANEYVLNPQLGYITLNRRLNDGEVLAVAYEYTVVGASNGESVFKVGEFSNDGINAPNNIAVKLLRSELLTTKRPGTEEPFPTWRLMMKNIYALGVFPLDRNNFRFEVQYRDDATGIAQNTLQNATTPNIANKPLINILNLDKLDQSQFAVADGDGFFDYVEGITVNTQYGYVIFPEPEPFGSNLDEVLTSASDKSKYVFKELYTDLKSTVQNSFQNKDKYLLKGYTKTENSQGIPIGSFNVPRGSVRVRAGGRLLVEGVDYVVDYMNGRVQIINPGLQASGEQISVYTENNSFFNQQRKTFFGVDVEHRFNETLTVGATFLNVTEQPITPKVNFGAEPINNTILGFNFDYSDEVPYLTKLANRLPFVDTDAPSNVSVRGDFAYLIPGSPSGIDVNGRATSYVDDFEASQVPIDLTSQESWYMASTPVSQGLGGSAPGLAYNSKRAKLAWYNIDQIFYGVGQTPSGVDDTELSRPEVRQIRYSELFPNQQLDVTQNPILRTLDLAFYPKERGAYNYSENISVSDGGVVLPNAEQNWGGIMRALTTNNFEQANVEYIQFWVMDPYENYSIKNSEGLSNAIDPNNPINQVGELYFNLGNISEDILKDNYKMYENGLPADGIKTPANVRENLWGNSPFNQSILYAFDVDEAARVNQDVGLDGLSNAEEIEQAGKVRPGLPTIPIKFKSLEDPAGDDFQYYRSTDFDNRATSILNRYKNYNNPQGNSPTANQSTESYPTSSTSYPDVEDINKDQTMNTIESYYEYKVSMNKSDLVVGQNFIVDEKVTSVTLENGATQNTKWYQFRIPVRSGVSVGGISDFNSIRFIRMFLTKFKMPVVLRFGELELVRGDWRRYTQTLDPTISPPQNLTQDQVNSFEVGVVNIEENEEIYVSPPGIVREQLQGATTIQLQNEQSATLKVKNLEPQETRAIYKNISADLRRYKELKMFMHLEEGGGNDEMVAILRLGTDLDDNFYQIELPLKQSTRGSLSPTEVWPEANNLNLDLSLLSKLKLERDAVSGIVANQLYPAPSVSDPKELTLRIKGNPTLAAVRTVMLGLKNTTNGNKTAEVWFNELRAVGFDNKGGWAAVLNADANFADVANVTLGGRMQTVGFGNVEDRVQQRSIHETKQYSVATNVALDKVLTPENWRLSVPMSFSYGEEFKDPEYNPQYQDVKQADALASGSNLAKRNAENSQDYTRRKSISFINVKKNRNPESKKKPKFYDVENIAVSYSYNQEFHKDYNVESYINKNVLAGATYSFNFTPWMYEPFKKSKALRGKYWRLIRDLNFNPVPKNIAINSQINRNYNEQRSRNLVEGFSAQPTLKQRRFLFDWDYTIGFDLTKSLQLNFNANNSYIYDNNNEEIDVFEKFFVVGRPDNYSQKLNATYKLPIDKIPYLDFIKADYAYTADFNWKSASQSYVERVGNMIQNANTHNLNGNLNFERLYKNLGVNNLFAKKNRRKKSSKNKASLPKLPRSVVQSKKKLSGGQKAIKGLVDVLTMVKKGRFSYSENNGTLLEGYTPKVGFLGRTNAGGGLAPSLGFVFGSQVDILNQAIANNWLITREETEEYYNKTFGKTNYKKFDYNFTLKPVKSLIIDVIGNKIKTSNRSQQLDVITDANGLNPRLNTTLKPFESGNFSSSHFMMGTAFKDGNTLFNEFKANRAIIASRLASENQLPIDGYKSTSQQVLLPAFIAAYSGTNANSVSTSLFRNIPIPNWTLRYNGLMKYKWFKKNFSSFTLTHGYKSSYTIGNYTNNLQYNPDANGVPNLNSSDAYEPERLISTATLIDEFSPLLRVDMKMRNSFSLRGEIKKDRSLTLNFNNSTLTDILGTEYVFGLGYRIKDVKFTTRFAGKKQRIKGDINLRADVSLRDNITQIRSIDIENNQITGGQRLFAFKFKADYNLTRNLTASLYYNHNTTKYAISTAFPMQSINAGLNILYNLGN